jgi:hypothetical protein
MAAKGDRTYKTLSKKVILVITNANMHSLQVRVYQCEAGLWWRAERSSGICSRVLRPTSANGDPRLLMKKVTRRGEEFRWQGVGRRSYFPLLCAFVLLLIVIS